MNIFEQLKTYWVKEGREFDKFYSTPAFSLRKLVSAFLDKRTMVLKNMLGDTSNKKILDLACGSGVQMVDLAPVCREIVGADISEELLKLAERELSLPKTKNWNLVLADAANLPFPDKSFDVIYALGLLDYVEAPAAILRECRRALALEGCVILTIPKKPSVFALFRVRPGSWLRRKMFHLPPIANACTRRQLLQMLEDSKFKPVRLRSLWSTMWIVKAM